MFHTRGTLIQFKLLRRRFCININKATKNNPSNDKAESSISKYEQAYRQLDNLDFMTATKMLLSEPPKKKKFGFDFHLVQFFFACMPSLAVYLVAQYARSEMRKMDAQLEQKKKKEEEEKAKEMELKAIQEREARSSDPEFLEVKVRLNKLEEAVKEIFVDSKKHLGDSVTKNHEDDEKKQIAATESGNAKSSIFVEKGHLGEQTSVESAPGGAQGKVIGSASIPRASLHDQGKNQNGRTSQDTK